MPAMTQKQRAAIEAAGSGAQPGLLIDAVRPDSWTERAADLRDAERVAQARLVAEICSKGASPFVAVKVQAQTVSVRAR